MSCCVSSNDNRYYVKKESSYGTVPSITAANRFPGVKLSARQTAEKVDRRDKTGGRTWLGIPTGTRRSTTFELKAYLTGWDDPAAEPGYGPLFATAMGGTPVIFNGGTVSSSDSPTRIRFSSTHGLQVGGAITYAGELRFVAAVVDPQTVELNAPFTSQPSGGSPIGPTITYSLANDLSTVSIFDHWSPVDAVQRILCGVAVNDMSINVNGDFHEFGFGGAALDILDSASFETGQGGLTDFPAEPVVDGYHYAVIPGHLGQVWLGITPARLYTLTHAELKLDNGIDVRNREFGTNRSRCIVAGGRSITLDFDLYEQKNDATKALYQAARQQAPIQAMFQLGQQ